MTILYYVLACLSVAMLVLLIAASASLPNVQALAASRVRGRWTRATGMRGFVFTPEPEIAPMSLASEIAAAGMQ